MKLLLFLISILTLESIYGQNGRLINKYYSKSFDKTDTVYYCKIEKTNKDYSFIFPELTSKYYQLTDSVKMTFDTIVEKTISAYGPYKFKRKRNKILFKESNKGGKYVDLYNLSGKEFFAPDLFSSSTDSYNILTKLLDQSVDLKIRDRNVNCLKFSQVIEYDYSKEFRVIYIDKKTLLPIRFEYFKDKELNIMTKEIFADNW